MHRICGDVLLSKLLTKGNSNSKAVKTKSLEIKKLQVRIPPSVHLFVSSLSFSTSTCQQCVLKQVPRGGAALLIFPLKMLSCAACSELNIISQKNYSQSFFARMLNLINVYGDNSTDIIATAIVLASYKKRGRGPGGGRNEG